MNISQYSIIDGSRGSGYQDDPYIMDELYIRGEATISWTVSGTGLFSVNLSDMNQRVYEENTAYHTISLYLNGVLKKVDASRLIKTEDFGATLQLKDNKSVIELVFNCDNEPSVLTEVSKITSFVHEESPASIEANSTTTTTIAPEELTEDEIVQNNGLRVASVDLSNSCGPYRIEISPDTGEFHYINNEIWFTGERQTERSYLVTVTAIDVSDQIINSQSFNFAIQECDSAEECVINPDTGQPTRPGGGGESGNDDDVVDDDLAAPTNLSVSTLECGVPESSTDDIPKMKNVFTWSSSAQDTVFDFQTSSGNTFNLLSTNLRGIIGSRLEQLFALYQNIFARVRQRDQETGRVSPWSEVLLFNTNPTGNCSGAITDPVPPEFVDEITCPTLIPVDPPEPPVNPPSPPPSCEGEGCNEPSPSPSPGPDTCFGSGCDENDPNNPDNPDNPNTPENPPAPYPPNIPTNPGCVGAGCGTGSGPSAPGGPETGDPGGPTGPGGEKPPTVPVPRVPACNDGEYHETVMMIKNDGDSVIYVTVQYSDTAPQCSDYLAAIGAEHGKPIEGQTDAGIPINPGQTLPINIGNICPECVYPCVTSPDPEPYEWSMVTTNLDPDTGEPTSQPYQFKATRQITTISCTCVGVPITDMVQNESYTQGGVSESVTYTVLNNVNTNNWLAVNRVPDPANEACIEIAQNQNRGNGEIQVRKKIGCFACNDRGEWEDVTNDIIACQVGFFDRYEDPQVTTRHASYPGHENMSMMTHQYSQNDPWSDMSFESWNLSSTPFQSSGWGLDTPLCVTCCEVTPDGDELNFRHLTGVIAGDTKASNSNPGIPFNNVSCPGGQPDFNLGGATGYSITGAGARLKNRTYIPPCVAGFITSTEYGGTVSQLGATGKQLGFKSYTRAEIDNGDHIDCQSTDNNGLDCSSFTVSADFSYYQEYELRREYCNHVVGEGTNLYGVQAGTNQFTPSISITWVNNEFCTNPISSNGNAAINPQFGANADIGQIVIPFGTELTTSYWNLSNLQGGWGAGTEIADGTTIDSTRFQVTLNVSPYIAGTQGGNPLP